MNKIGAKMAKWGDGWVIAFFGAGLVLRRWKYGVLGVVVAIGFAWVMSLVGSGDTDVRLLFSDIGVMGKV
jgi:hypothetical protein